MAPHCALARNFKTIVLAWLIVLLLPSSWIITGPSSFAVRGSWTYSSGFDPHGPFIDQLLFQIYPVTDIARALLALRLGTVDGYDEQVPTDLLESLLGTPGVEVKVQPGTRFRLFVFNTQRFPTNITGYRRALTYALDKYEVADRLSYFAGEPMDGVIPRSIPRWTYEDQITEHFYTQDIAIANLTLEAIGFADLDQDGWREYDANGDHVWNPGIDIDDGGSVFNQTNPGCHFRVFANPCYCVDYAVSQQLLLDGMVKCGLRGSMEEIANGAMYDRVVTGDFWAYPLTWTVDRPGEPEDLYDLFFSGSEMNQLFFHYVCSEYDCNVTALVHSTTYEEARAWAWNCSRLLLRDMPVLPLVLDPIVNAYRVDRWEGYVNMTGLNRMGNNPWTPRKLYLKPSAVGSDNSSPVIYREVLSEGMDTTNVIMTNSDYTDRVMMNIYSRLWALDPHTWEMVPDLAYAWTIERTAPSGQVQEGQRFTFNLYANVTWHDGTPLTAEDVKYSLETIWRLSRGSFSSLVKNIYRIDTPDPHTVVIYSNASSYFEFSRATGLYILPKHIWELHYDFTSWAPSSNRDLTGSGPFRWSASGPGEYIALDRYENYHLRAVEDSTPPVVDWIPIALASVAVASVVVAVSVILLRRQRTHRILRS